MKKIVKLVFALMVLVPVLALGVFFLTFDKAAFRAAMMEQASTALGRPVNIKGAINFDMKDGWVLAVDGIEIGNPEGFKAPYLAKIGTLALSLNWKALLEHKVEVKSFALQAADIQLVTNAAGKNNWELAPSKNSETSLTPAKTEGPSGAESDAVGVAVEDVKKEIKNRFRMDTVDLSNIKLLDTKITQTDERGGKKQTLLIDKATIDAPAVGALKVDAEGSIDNNVLLKVVLTAGQGWKALAEGKPSSVDVHLTHAGQGYAVKGTLSRDGKIIQLADMQAKAMGIDATGALRLNPEGKMPHLSGKLAIPMLNLLTMQKAEGDVLPRVVSAVAIGRIRAVSIAAEVKKAPDLSVLKTLNADINLAIGALTFAEGKTLDDVATHLVLQNGDLRLNPLKASFMGLPYEGALALEDTATGNPLVHFALRGERVDVPALAKAFGSHSPVQAPADVVLDLKGRGLDPEALKHTLTGSIQLVFGSGTFDLGGNDSKAVALMKILFPQGAVQANPRLNCSAIRFNARDGTLTSNGLLLDSNFATVAGEGSLNLASNDVSMVMRHVSKESKSASLMDNVPLRVSGHLGDLSFMPEESALVQKAATLLGGSSAPVSSGVPRVDAAVGGKNPCLAALQNPQMIMLTPTKPQDALKDTVKDATQRYKDIRDQAKDMIKGKDGKVDPANLMKGLFGH